MKDEESEQSRRRLRFSLRKNDIYDRRGSKTLDQLWGRGRDIPETPDEDRQLSTCPKYCRRR